MIIHENIEVYVKGGELLTSIKICAYYQLIEHIQYLLLRQVCSRRFFCDIHNSLTGNFFTNIGILV